MPDDHARRMAASDHSSDRDRLKLLTNRYAGGVQQFLDDLTAGSEVIAGRARQLATDALEIAMLAERVEAEARTLVYLDAPTLGAGQ